MKTAWRQQGIFFGIVLGLCRVMYEYINSTATIGGPANLWLNSGLIAAVLCLLFAAGIGGARTTGTIASGTYAGLTAAGVSVIIGLATLGLFTFMFMDALRQNTGLLQDFHRSGLRNMDQFIIDDALGAAFVSTVFSFGVGGLLGTTGGALGAKFKH